MNKVILRGRLGRDPQIYANGKICKFSIATDERHKGREGNWETKTVWHNIVVFGTLAERASNALYKGASVTVFGSIDEEAWSDKTTGEIKKQTVIKCFEAEWEKAGAVPKQEELPPEMRDQQFPSRASGMDDVPF